MRISCGNGNSCHGECSLGCQNYLPLSSHAVLREVRAVVIRKFIKGVDSNNGVTGNEKRLAVIIECELIDDLPERMIGKTINISEYFSQQSILTAVGIPIERSVG